MIDTATSSHEPLISQRDSSERALLSESHIFDEPGYVARAGEDARRDPIGHYLDIGWRLGLEPNESFPGTALLPYFAAMGASGPPAITWLVLRSAGWPMPGSRDEIEHLAQQVSNTTLFNDSHYRSQLGPDAKDLDPAIHYVTVGERLGLAPSPEFDPKYYADRNPDVAAAGMNCLLHFVQFGHSEGRMPKPADVCKPGRAKFVDGRDNVILVVHDASRTGAPILGWNLARIFAQRYNIFTVCLGEGELEPQFLDVSVEVYGHFLGYRRHPVELEYSLRTLLAARRYRFAIVNSAESRMVVEPFVRQLVPTLLLIHEFASYVHPVSSLNSALDWSTEVVFSASIVAMAAEQAHPNLASRKIHILPQGVTELPPGGVERRQQDEAYRLLDCLAAKRETDGFFIVLGVGVVHLRKGVDLFLSAAAAVLRRQPRRPIHFLWVGDGYRPRDDMNYSVYLQEQMNRSGLAEHVTFLGVVPDVEPAYRIADAFFLSSRLDPLPNSAIDAAVAGIPVVCFREASGIAELLLENPDTAVGVVDHLDSEAAAGVLFDLAMDRDLYARISGPTRDLARAVFDLDKYCSKLEAIGTSASARMQHRALDAATLIDDPTFDQDFFLGPSQCVEPRRTTVHRYLARSAARGWTLPHAPDPYLRRPSPGFNPRIYAAAHLQSLQSGVDPLADFVRRGKPPGPWQTLVLRPDAPPPRVTPGSCRVALHAHFFYPELCADFLAHLAPNQSECDLLISTDDSMKAKRLERTLHGYSRGNVTIRVVPNRGRDLGPLLTELAPDLDQYEFIGHVHSKRSQWANGKPAQNTWGDTWREFLWQNLLGGLHPMRDRIIAAFKKDDTLGLVFPSDPNLVGWDKNRDCAAKLAPRIGWHAPLPEHFDFPLGNMFWIRRVALQPFLDLHLTWEQYPAEPAPYDGTLLHALERLWPMACEAAGFHCAVTHVYGVTWSPAAL